jgi:tRNA (guanine37-N1)-methyltransferase
MTDDMLRPPVNRAMRTLDRAFFKKALPVAAARIFNNQHISQCRMELQKSKDLLAMDRLSPIISDPESGSEKAGMKCLLLHMGIKHDGMLYAPAVYTELISPGRCLNME